MSDTRQSDIHEPIATERERDRWVRLFNRLDAAVTHHQKATREQGFTEVHDDALYAARARILRDAADPLSSTPDGNSDTTAAAIDSGARPTDPAKYSDKRATVIGRG